MKTTVEQYFPSGIFGHHVSLRGLFIFLVFVSSSLFSQNTSYHSVVDSLEKELAKTEGHDARLKILSDMLRNTIFNDLDEAYQITERFETEATLSGDSTEMARSKNFYGMIAGFAGDNFRAISAYEEALEWYQALKDTFMIGMMYNNLGSAYEFEADRETSIRYFKMAQEYFARTGNVDWIVYTKFNLAGQYLASERMLEARALLLEVLPYFEEQEDYDNLSEVYLSLAECKKELESLDAAIPYIEKIEPLLEYLDISSEIRFRNLKCVLMSDMGDYSAAEAQCLKACELSLGYGMNKLVMDSYENTYLLYKIQGKYQEALTYHERLQELGDSTLTEMMDDQVVNLMTKYEVREKSKEIELKDKELEQSKNLRNLFIMLLGVIGLLLLVSILFTRSKIRSNNRLSKQKLVTEKSLADKELLLREIHHRVKNNMQVISSLLSIQSRDIKDEKALKAVNDSRNRVRAMALIHQSLYTEDDLKGIRTQEYITKLSNSLFSSYRVDVDRVKLEMDVDEMVIDVDSIVPIGLIINELMTNSLKYAFPDERKGTITIIMKEVPEGLRLEVADDGIGIPPERQAASEESFGMKMLKAFSKKLDAEWEIQSQEGTRMTMLIKSYKGVAA
jgi:two-component sensor histidine kinase